MWLGLLQSNPQRRSSPRFLLPQRDGRVQQRPSCCLLAVTTNVKDGARKGPCPRESGQAVAEYAFLFAMLLVLVGLMILVGRHVNAGFNWIVSILH